MGRIQTTGTCCSLGPGLDALAVHCHLFSLHCDLGQSFIIRPHAVGKDLGQSQTAHSHLIHSEEAGLCGRMDRYHTDARLMFVTGSRVLYTIES